MITPENLDAFIQNTNSRLIYLNACDSEGLAEKLVTYDRVQFAIGSGGAIQHDHGLQGALSFYARLLAGDTVQAAFSVARSMVSALSSDRASIALKAKTNRPFTFVPTPKIIAKFSTTIPERPRSEYQVHLGIENARHTNQVVFFTTDEEYIKKYYQNNRPLGEVLAAAARETVPSDRIWSNIIYETWFLSDLMFRNDPYFTRSASKRDPKTYGWRRQNYRKRCGSGTNPHHSLG